MAACFKLTLGMEIYKKVAKSGHNDLVKRGALWLSNHHRCGVVLTERQNWGIKQPDIIGWHDWESYLIEIKVSRSDFAADRKKPFRGMQASGMGRHWYYLCPKDLLKMEEIPEGWGLLYATEDRIREIQKPAYFDLDEFALKSEMGFLVKAIRHINWCAIINPYSREAT